jgi:tetratricopeptide (TPR) repeat protein
MSEAGKDGKDAQPNGGYQPRQFPGVIVSSTFKDLKEDRAAVIEIVNRSDFKAIPMEYDTAKPMDVIESSLRMVRDASAYVGLIGHKLGQVPIDPVRNPERLCITELEFNEARRLGRPILLFIMSPDYLVPQGDSETPTRTKKLKAFIERAKQMTSDSRVHRVYDTFKSVEDLTSKAMLAVPRLHAYIEPQLNGQGPATFEPTLQATDKSDPIPKPPQLYAEPRYIGLHKFLGRKAQLAVLDDWAAAADPYPVLLFDAIGGTGKSILTWEWMTGHSAKTRTDWQGRFWYSFYEKGADMGDFCRRALAYMTEKPLEELRKKKTAELREPLLHQLQLRPWLVVLDGLERVLVAYHRIDAAEVRDDQASQLTDQIAGRDPCDAIRPEDDDLLRSLAGAAPSKLLITTRLVPKVLLNQAGQGINGVKREPLPGLLAEDAEALLRSCDVAGDSPAIQRYLKSNCDCHPLVIGALGGLIQDYLPDPGNFDAWAGDPGYGASLNLADLELKQRQNHILKAAINGVPEESRKLLSMMALLSEAVDYPALSALSPFLPPEPKEMKGPDDPRKRAWWELHSEGRRKSELTKYEAALSLRKEYEREIADWRRTAKSIASAKPLAAAIKDLKRRGLLQFDRVSKRYDLHPVVRSVASGGLKAEEKDGYGQRLVDYFTAQPHSPYEQAETLEDVQGGLHIVRALLKMGRYQQACDAYRGDLSSALLFNLEARSEVLSLLRPFFQQGWGVLPGMVNKMAAGDLANAAAVALLNLGALEESLAPFGAALGAYLEQEEWQRACTGLHNLSVSLFSMKRLSQEDRCLWLALDLAELNGGQEDLFSARFFRFMQLAGIGRWPEAWAMWGLLDPMGRNWSRGAYRPGDAEWWYALFRHWQGDLSEEDLIRAESLAKAGKNRGTIRALHSLRGNWRMDRGEWALAAGSYGEALRMAREVGRQDHASEARLALARFHLGQSAEARLEAERLSAAKDPPDLALAELWLALGEHARAKKHALAAYTGAWADGEPYVFRYGLDKARALLEKLGAEIPNLPPYDPAKDGKFPCEDEVVAAIARLRAEKEAKAAKGAEAAKDKEPY